MSTDGAAPDVVDFLSARIAEAETVARDWKHQGSAKVTVHGGGTGYHALINPDRVLAQCAAWRRVVELHSGDHVCQRADHPVEGDRGETMERDGRCATNRTLAAAWSDHPDHRQEWRP